MPGLRPFLFLISFFTAIPARAGDRIRIDGGDTDWRFASTAWDQSNRNPRAGSLRRLAFAADTDSLYVYYKLNAPAPAGGSFEIRIDFDLDGNAATGREGAETRLTLFGAGGKRPGGGQRWERFPPRGNLAGTGEGAASGSWRPDYPDPGNDWAEHGFALRDLGFLPGAEVRFTARVAGPGGQAWLKGADRISTSPLRYRIGAERSVDGYAVDWARGPFAWSDNPADAGGGGNDLARLAMHADGEALYVYLRMEAAFPPAAPGGGGAQVRIEIDADGESSTGPRGCDVALLLRAAAGRTPTASVSIMRYRPDSCRAGCLSGTGGEAAVARPGECQGKAPDWAEYRIPLSALGLAPGPAFRFTAHSGTDYLQEDSVLASTRLYFGKETVYLGAVFGDLAPSKADAKLAGLAEALLGDSNIALRAGRGYVVRLAAHASNGVSPRDAWPSPDSLDFGELHALLPILRARRVAYFPLLAFHTLPVWQARILAADTSGAYRYRMSDGSLLGASEFRPFHPGSEPALAWCDRFGRAAVAAMRPDLHATIPAILAGNEYTYPQIPGEAPGRDRGTLAKWRQSAGARAPFPTRYTADYMRFRSRALTEVFRGWQACAEAGSYGVPAATKLVPYLIGDRGTYLANAYFPAIYDYLSDPATAMIPIDPYPPEPMQLQRVYRLGKPMVLAEFNKSGWSTPTAPAASEIRDWIATGVDRYGVRAAFFFAWDDAGADCRKDCARAYPEQREGLRRAVDSVLKLDAPSPRRRLAKALIPDDEEFLSDGAFSAGKMDPGYFMQGIFALASRAQADDAGLAVEIDYKIRDEHPEAVVQTASGDFAVGTDALARRPTWYLLRGHCRVSLPGGRVLETIAPGGPDIYRVAAKGFSLAPGTDGVLGWTPQSRAGNQALSLRTANGQSLPMAKDMQVLLERNGLPAAIRIGACVFSASDPPWFIGHEEGNPLPARFFSEVLEKMAAGWPDRSNQ